MDRIAQKLAELARPSTWYGWRLYIQSWWYTRDKSQFLFAGILFGALLGTALGIYHLSRYAGDSRQAMRELNCLAHNIYHEARGESRAGQYAVAEVTMNRVASTRFPQSVCEVVYEQRWDRIRKRHVGAFSWTELERREQIAGPAYQHALKVAEDVYYRRSEPQVEGALFYHASYIRPSWARSKRKVTQIGRHIFYR